ncbi:2-succinyl-6-hydroxy-2,4-cyclohexadiene-1-carboxylate synthase [Bacillus fonticola]|uniref:2-succinyl-6-hydroxy-2, 4-cyclohexadiene-1-carboxylate synthase n=1 Tax=Bacillus fonticola TaxID=2728853 RepID=UPI001D13C682|nr:2-succinyl-6-hydroxy-2,4-cyclohexadiene-1-carboxylate synthase [Bacillus fonticola]
MKSLSIRGVTYKLHQYGEGEPVVLLHGFMGSHQTWHTLYENKGYKWYAFDLLGHGKSSAPLHFARYDCSAQVEDLYACMQSEGLSSFHLIGYSMGGRLALAFACRYPHMIRTLTLESASPGLLSREAREQRSFVDEGRAHQIETEGCAAFVADWEQLPLFQSQQTLPLSVRQRIRLERMSHTDGGLAGSLRGFSTGRQPSFWGKLNTLAFPIHLVTGGEDKKFVQIARKMKRIMPNCIHIVIPNVGHAPHVEAPIKFSNAVTTFLYERGTES